MFNENKTPLDKAIGVISILSDPTENKLKEIAEMYKVSYGAIKRLMTPVNLNGRVIYMTKEKATRINITRQARLQWSRNKSRELIGHLPGVVFNKKHARQTDSNQVLLEDLDSKEMARKVISQLRNCKKESINTAWEQLIKSN